MERGERRPVEDHWDPESGAGISVVFPRGKKVCGKHQREIILERQAENRPWGRFLRLRMCVY